MEIGTRIVRLAEVAKTGNKVKVLKTYAYDTEMDVSRNGRLRLTDEAVAAIDQGLKDSGIKATNVYFLVESTEILYKNIELEVPRSASKYLQSAIEQNFSDYFKQDQSLYHVSYVKKKSYEKNGKKMTSLDVFAVRNDLSESYYKLAVALGLNAKGLRHASHSALTLFKPVLKQRNLTNVAMVNINEDMSSLTIAVDGEMVLNKTIACGVSNAIQYIIDSPISIDHLTPESAAELLYTQNVLLKELPEDDTPPDAMNDEMKEKYKLQYDVTMSLAPLLKAIESTFVSFLQKEGLKIKEIQISGLGAGFSGISQLMTKEFGVSVAVTQQLDNVIISKQIAEESELLLSFYPAIGSIFDKSELFTPEEKAGGDVAAKKNIDNMFLAGGVIIAMAAGAWSFKSLYDANAKLEETTKIHKNLNQKIDELRAQGVETAYDNFVLQQSYHDEVQKLYDQTKSGNEDITVFLDELETVLSPDTRVISLDLTPKSADVSIVCKDDLTAAACLHYLRNMKTTHAMDCRGVGDADGPNGEVLKGFKATFLLKGTEDRQKEKEAEEAMKKAQQAEAEALAEANGGETSDESVNSEDIPTETESVVEE